MGSFALLIAATTFGDEGLRPLTSPASDIEQLGITLRDADTCGYEVSSILNGSMYEVRRKIQSFFQDKKPDDLLLLYISTHGLKDEHGALYFATSDTYLNELEASTVESSFVYRMAKGSRARRQIIVLDACFSGAFGGVLSSKGGAIARENFIGVELAEPKDESRGIVVYAASMAHQISNEKDRVRDIVQPSVFTSHLIEGIRSGAADENQDGVISDDELFAYAKKKTRDERPNQIPQRWVIGGLDRIDVSRTKSNGLPSSVEDALSEDAPLDINLGAVNQLEKYARGKNIDLAIAAVARLKKLKEHDRIKVQRKAAEVISGLEGIEQSSLHANSGRISTSHPIPEISSWKTVKAAPNVAPIERPAAHADIDLVGTSREEPAEVSRKPAAVSQAKNTLRYPLAFSSVLSEEKIQSRPFEGSEPYQVNASDQAEVPEASLEVAGKNPVWKIVVGILVFLFVIWWLPTEKKAEFAPESAPAAAPAPAASG